MEFLPLAPHFFKRQRFSHLPISINVFHFSITYFLLITPAYTYICLQHLSTWNKPSQVNFGTQNSQNMKEYIHIHLSSRMVQILVVKYCMANNFLLNDWLDWNTLFLLCTWKYIVDSKLLNLKKFIYDILWKITVWDL